MPESIPNAPPAARGIDLFEQTQVLRDFFLGRCQHQDAHAFYRVLEPRLPLIDLLQVHGEAFLASGHREVHLGEQPRIEQRAVQRAGGIVYLIALAQRIQPVALAGMQILRDRRVSMMPRAAVSILSRSMSVSSAFRNATSNGAL